MEINQFTLDKMLEYQELVKKYETYIQAVKDVIREKGSFCIPTHACVVVDREKDTLCNLDELLKHVSRSQLQEWGVLRKTPYRVVFVSRTEAGKIAWEALKV